MARPFDRLPALVIAIGLAALVPVSAAAQPRSSAPQPRSSSGMHLTFGAEAGITSATLRFTDAQDLVKPLTGGMFGGWVGIQPTKIIGVVAAFDYVGRGTHEDGGPGVLRLHYLEIPVMAQGSILSLNHGRTRVLLLGGISFGMKVGATQDGSATAPDGSSVSDTFKSTDFGGVVGAMVEHGRLGGGVRATWGLTDILADFPVAGEFKNKTLIFLASYRIK